MPYREVRVVDCQEELRRWLGGDGIHSISRATGLDRKTARKMVKAAREMNLRPGDPWPEENVVAAFAGKARNVRPPTPPGNTEKLLLEQVSSGIRQGFPRVCG